jgi:hypothetical protein
MKTKRFRIVIAILVVAMVGGVGWLVLRPREPVYEGKPLSYWLGGRSCIQIGEAPLEVNYGQVVMAVHQVGTNAIPELLRSLRAKDSVRALRFVRLARKQHFIKFRYISPILRHNFGVYGFGMLGADGKGAVPALIEIYKENVSENSQLATATVLGSIGPSARQAVPLLLQGMKTTNLQARATHIIALGQIHAEPALVVPVLVDCLHSDADMEDRVRAAEALGKFEAEAKPAVPELVALLDGDDIGVRAVMAAALKAIDPEAAAKAGVR